MIHGEWKTALIDIDVDDTKSAEVDLGRAYETLMMVVPTRTVSCQITIEVAEKTGGTFQEIYATDPADGGDNKVISAAGTGAFTWVVPLGGFQYIKVKLSASQTGADQTFRVMGVRS